MFQEFFLDFRESGLFVLADFFQYASHFVEGDAFPLDVLVAVDGELTPAVSSLPHDGLAITQHFALEQFSGFLQEVGI